MDRIQPVPFGLSISVEDLNHSTERVSVEPISDLRDQDSDHDHLQSQTDTISRVHLGSVSS
jgi:hypothetical protein